mmetsp:Transcript_120705/g.346828  ORF Transcript_120705/g.346828 Transcript_120705/m.346828 type:complete len:672 (-) Transcript_120705:249-2264(-)
MTTASLHCSRRCASSRLRRPRPGLFFAVCFAEFVPALAASGNYPNYANPITARPPLPHPPGSGGLPCASVAVILDAALSEYVQVERGWFDPPQSCPAPWGQVVLEFSGAVAGHQYDRYGAVWFRGVELLRTTTPEPSPAGIHWRIEKDVSDYASLFAEAGELTLQIPNIVNDTYTGVLQVNLTLHFLVGGWEAPKFEIVPLRNVTAGSFPLEDIDVRGESNEQVNSVSLPRSASAVRLDVYASAHGCEEFWYINELNGSLCGGGASRELRVLVDGHLAGAQYPFPAMYTGGLNPFLWRPLTGILSFDIPAYRFDLTPFLAWLTDGEEHNVTLQVIGMVPDGFWLLDGVMVIEHSEDEVASGTVEVLPSEKPRVWETVADEADSMTVQQMRTHTDFHVRGNVLKRSGARSESAVVGSLKGWSRNTFIGDEQDMVGGWRAVINTMRDGKLVTFTAEYPLRANVIYREDERSFQLEATVDASRDVEYAFRDARPGKALSPRSAPEGAPKANWIRLENRMRSHALYNRTRTGRGILSEADTSSSSRFAVSVGPARQAGGDSRVTCYRRSLASEDGAVTEDRLYDDCAWLHAPYVCGQELCGGMFGRFAMPSGGSLSDELAEAEAQHPPAPPTAAAAAAAEVSDFLLVRLARWEPPEHSGGERLLSSVGAAGEAFV